jgi:hypothetical protein
MVIWWAHPWELPHRANLLPWHPPGHITPGEYGHGQGRSFSFQYLQKEGKKGAGAAAGAGLGQQGSRAAGGK